MRFEHEYQRGGEQRARDQPAAASQQRQGGGVGQPYGEQGRDHAGCALGGEGLARTVPQASRGEYAQALRPIGPGGFLVARRVAQADLHGITALHHLHGRLHVARFVAVDDRNARQARQGHEQGERSEDEHMPAASECQQAAHRSGAYGLLCARATAGKARPMSVAQKSPGSNDPLVVSVVLPAHNESGNLGPLIAEIDKALFAVPHEIVVVDDASTDDTRERLMALKDSHAQLRVLAHESNAGQSRALRTAIRAARAPIIATLDSDGQNDPADLPALLERLTRDGAPDTLAMVGGRRVKRRDTAAKRAGSRIGNGVRKRLLRDDCDDTGCGIKVFRRDAFLELPYFDHIHRYLPALMAREGYTAEYVDVNHRERGAGQSKYTNFGRLKVSVADLRGVRWLQSRARNPGAVEEL